MAPRSINSMQEMPLCGQAGMLQHNLLHNWSSSLFKCNLNISKYSQQKCSVGPDVLAIIKHSPLSSFAKPPFFLIGSFWHAALQVPWRPRVQLGARSRPHLSPTATVYPENFASHEPPSLSVAPRNLKKSSTEGAWTPESARAQSWVARSRSQWGRGSVSACEVLSRSSIRLY